MIRARIKQRLRAGGDNTPAVVAADVLAGLADGELRDALAVALPYLVRDEYRKQWYKAMGPLSVRADTSSTRPAERDRWAESAETRRQAGAAGAARSAQVRDRKAKLLATPISVRGEWKPLGDCTAGDLRAIADDIAAKADSYHRRAEQLRDLADKIAPAGGTSVSDLDAGDISAALDITRAA